MRAVALWRWRDAALVVLLAGAALWEALVQPLSPPGYVGRPWVALLGTVVVTAPVLLRRARPVLYAAAVTVGNTLLWSQARGEGELPFVGFASYLLAAYGLGAHLPRRDAVLAGAVVLAAWGVPDVVDARAGVPSVHQDVGFYVLAALALAAGAGVRALRRQSEALHQALEDLAAERLAREAAVAEQERHRIARDMHDVLTHTMSAVAVQAGALRVELGEGPGAAVARTLEESARAAMRELRQLLGLLRDDAPGLRPSPGLDSVDALLAPLRAAGVDVRVRRTEGLEDVAAGPALVAYRVVQESLTNVAKHSGGCSVEVRLERDGTALRVSVVDDGRPAEPTPRPGLGLTGMRERLAAYGGTLEAGPRQSGTGWAVHAVLPL